MNKEEAVAILDENGFGTIKWIIERHFYHKCYVRYQLLAEELEAINTLLR